MPREAHRVLTWCAIRARASRRRAAGSTAFPRTRHDHTFAAEYHTEGTPWDNGGPLLLTGPAIRPFTIWCSPDHEQEEVPGSGRDHANRPELTFRGQGGVPELLRALIGRSRRHGRRAESSVSFASGEAV